MAIDPGPLTLAQLRDVWRNVSDEGYTEPLERAGDGDGFEAWQQLFAQLARASKAVDVTTQAMFISGWSGQTNPPAAGGQQATVTLAFARTLRLENALLLKAGEVFVAEEQVDFAPGGGQAVLTGRRYVLAADLWFPPGTKGPFTVLARAEFEGYGYNNPLPGTIKRVPQPGSVFTNDVAEVQSFTAAPTDAGGVTTYARLVSDNQPDMPIPDTVGQCLLFMAGANAGRVVRASAFLRPDPPLHGSSVDIDMLFSVGLNPVAGTFVVGEQVQVLNGATVVAYATVIDDRTVNGVRALGLRVTSGPASSIVIANTFLGVSSGATGTIWNVGYSSAMTAEAPTAGIGGATWRVLDWALDWGLTVTNASSPSGGRAAMLDELGQERALPRADGEPDEIYRQRVREPADVVSPNAIKRALNRTLSPTPWCLREVGSPGLPGFFFDGDAQPPSMTPHGAVNDAWDTDTILFAASPAGPYAFAFQEPAVFEDATTLAVHATGYVGRVTTLAFDELTFVRYTGGIPSSLSNTRIRGLHTGTTFGPLTDADASPQAQPRRYHLWLDYVQFRAFFVVSVAPLSFGESGFAYDAGTQLWGYDLPSPYWVGYDGQPWETSPIYKRAYEAVDKARAAGVTFTFNQDGGSCP